jgi:hypothetical protein
MCAVTRLGEWWSMNCKCLCQADIVTSFGESPKTVMRSLRWHDRFPGWDVNPAPSRYIRTITSCTDILFPHSNLVTCKKRLLGNLGTQSLGRPRKRWEDNIRMDLMKIRCKDRLQMGVTRDRTQYQLMLLAPRFADNVAVTGLWMRLTPCLMFFKDKNFEPKPRRTDPVSSRQTFRKWK